MGAFLSCWIWVWKEEEEGFFALLLKKCVTRAVVGSLSLLGEKETFVWKTQARLYV